MNTPRIAVDARPLCHPGTGIYRYTFELLKRMCPLGGEWYFYSPQPYDIAEFSYPNVQHRIAGVPSFLRASQLGQWFFPIWAKRDAVDVFWSPRHQLPLMLSADIRAVVTIHDLVWRRFGETMRFPGRQIESFLMPRSLKMAHDIVAVSEFTRAELNNVFSLPEEKIHVVTGASHIGDGTGGAGKSGSEADPYFLFVGTMEPRKNLQRLLRAYRNYVSEARSPLGLRIAGGPGWGGLDIRKAIEQLSLGNNIELLGRLDDEKLRALYSGAHALLMPSLYEGFGLPIVESLSLGVPVITSRDSAMSEVAGDAAILVDPFSELEICDAMARMTTDTTLYATLAKRAFKESRRYDWQRSAASMFSLLTRGTVT